MKTFKQFLEQKLYNEYGGMDADIPKTPETPAYVKQYVNQGTKGLGIQTYFPTVFPNSTFSQPEDTSAAGPEIVRNTENEINNINLFLKELGVSPTEIKEIQKAIESDFLHYSKGKLHSDYKNLFKNIPSYKTYNDILTDKNVSVDVIRKIKADKYFDKAIEQIGKLYLYVLGDTDRKNEDFKNRKQTWQFIEGFYGLRRSLDSSK